MRWCDRFGFAAQAASIGARTHSEVLAKDTAEISGIGEPAVVGDGRQRLGIVHQQFAGLMQTLTSSVSNRRRTKTSAEFGAKGRGGGAEAAREAGQWGGWFRRLGVRCVCAAVRPRHRAPDLQIRPIIPTGRRPGREPAIRPAACPGATLPAVHGTTRRRCGLHWGSGGAGVALAGVVLRDPIRLRCSRCVWRLL